jgi:hypothetical protein
VEEKLLLRFRIELRTHYMWNNYLTNDLTLLAINPLWNLDITDSTAPWVAILFNLNFSQWCNSSDLPVLNSNFGNFTKYFHSLGEQCNIIEKFQCLCLRLNLGPSAGKSPALPLGYHQSHWDGGLNFIMRFVSIDIKPFSFHTCESIIHL